mmetsp:Transcript_133474/g.217367  ORF Transcript_133474/g.217367 Transcript_133474/m.217367 type:complete len:209 (-) Transcript_133474:292-918(-)
MAGSKRLAAVASAASSLALREILAACVRRRLVGGPFTAWPPFSFSSSFRSVSSVSSAPSSTSSSLVSSSSASSSPSAASSSSPSSASSSSASSSPSWASSEKCSSASSSSISSATSSSSEESSPSCKAELSLGKSSACQLDLLSVGSTSKRKRGPRRSACRGASAIHSAYPRGDMGSRVMSLVDCCHASYSSSCINVSSSKPWTSLER